MSELPPAAIPPASKPRTKKRSVTGGFAWMLAAAAKVRWLFGEQSHHGASTAEKPPTPLPS